MKDQNKDEIEDNIYITETKNLILKKKWNLNQTKYYIFFFQILTGTLADAIVGYAPGIQGNLLEFPYNFTNFQYGLFFAIPALPNLICPLFVGIILDQYGYHPSLIILLEGLILIGILLTILGSYYVIYFVMIIGQGILGIGYENLLVLLKRFILKLSTKENSLGLWSVLLVSGRLGMIISAFLAPFIYSLTESVTICFLVELLLGVVLCIFFNISFYLSENTDFPEENNDKKTDSDDNTQKELSIMGFLVEFLKQSDLMFWLAISLILSNFIMICGLFSEFNNFISKAINVSAVEASYYVIYYAVLAGIIQLLVGCILGNYGYYIQAMLIGSFITIISSIVFIDIFGTEQKNLIICPLSLLAFGYSIKTAFIFSSFAFIVDKKYYGISYGISSCFLAFGALAGPLLFGYLRDISLKNMEGYYWPMMETLVFQVLNLLIAILICILDYFYLKKGLSAQKKDKI